MSWFSRYEIFGPDQFQFNFRARNFNDREPAGVGLGPAGAADADVARDQHEIDFFTVKRKKSDKRFFSPWSWSFPSALISQLMSDLFLINRAEFKTSLETNFNLEGGIWSYKENPCWDFFSLFFSLILDLFGFWNFLLNNKSDLANIITLQW